MPGRGFSAGTQYRYGFNGQEKSTEIGEGLTTAEFWEYDSRIGRRWNVDPLTAKFPNMSPYSAFANSPISHVDVDGNYALFIHYMLTKYVLKQLGVSDVQATLIAHYASIYADNPGGVGSSNDAGATSKKTMVILLTNYNGATSENPVFAEMGNSKLSTEEAMAELHYLPGIDYSRTDRSQSEDASSQRFHATRTYKERNIVSAAEAVNRSFSFAWDCIFSAAMSGGFEKMDINSNSIQDFTQGLHSFQDIEAHGGAVFRATWKNIGGLKSKDGNEHNMGNDSHPNQNNFLDAKYLTINATKVFMIMTGGIDKLGNDNGDILTRGMSKKQVQQLRSKIKDAGYSIKTTGKNSFNFLKN